MQIGEAFITIRPDTKGFNQQLTGEVQTAGRSAGSRISSALTGAIAGGAAVKVLGDAFNAAVNLNEAVSLTGVVFEDSAGSIRSFGEDSAQSVGLAESEALSFANTIGGLFIGMGTSREEAARLSTEIVTLGADLASAKNLTGGTAEALEILRSGLVGEVEPLRRVGVALNAARVEQQALADTGKESASALTEGEKAAARYALIVQDLGAQGVVGDFQRTASGAANQQRILAAEWQNTQAVIGQQLIPAFDGLKDAVNEALPLIERVGPALGDVSESVGDLASRTSGVVGFFESLGDKVPGVASALGDLLGVVNNLINPVMMFGNLSEAAGSATNNWLNGDFDSTIADVARDVQQAAMGAGEANRFAASQLLETGEAADEAAGSVNELAGSYERLNNLLSDQEATIQARQALRDLKEEAFGSIEGGVTAEELDSLRLGAIGYAQDLQAVADAANTTADGTYNARGAQRDLLASMQAVRQEIPAQLIPMWDQMIRTMAQPARLNADGTPARNEISEVTRRGEAWNRERYAAELDADTQPVASAYQIAVAYGLDWQSKRYAATFDATGAPGSRRAAGGPVEANDLYLVGERGPELFMSDRAGKIIPNHQITTGGSGSSRWGGGTTIVNVNVPGVMTAEVIERVIVPRVMLELDRAERRRGY